jgi:hypothetical protein
MSYFDQILGGSIPLSVIESLEGFQNDYRLNNQFKHWQLNEGMVNEIGNAPLNMTKLLDSTYGAHVRASLELDREKILSGVYKLLDAATNDALNRNRSELAMLSKLADSKSKIKEEDKKVIDRVITQFCADLSNSIVLLISGIKMDEQMKKILINIVHLTGVTNKSINEIRDIEKKTALLLELPRDFKNKNRIHICETLKNKLTPANIKKCEKDLIRKCVFDNQFLMSLSFAIVQSLEHILGNIMNLTKYDRICYFYAFSVELSNAIVNVSLPEPKTPKSESPKEVKLKRKVIEKFGVSIGNTDINVDTTKIKDIKEIEKKIDQSKVISGMNKMLSSAINKATSKNQADLLKAIAASNKLTIGKVKGDSFTFTNITQTSKIESETNANFVQTIKNKVMNDISVSLKQNIDMVQKESLKDMNKTTINEKTGTSIGDVLTGVAGTIGQTVGKLADAAKDILSVNIGNKTEKRTEKDITQQLKDKFELNQSFQFKDDNDVANKIENLLSSENLAKCAETSNAANEINLGEIDVKGAINISNLKQESIVTSVMKCVFNQEVLNDLSTKIVNSQEKLIKQLIENTKEYKNESDRQKVQGDIYAAGTAASAMISSAGTAVSEAAQGAGKGIKDAGAGVSDAAQGVGKGVSTAAEGVGKGVGNILSNMTAPLIVGAIILVLLIIGYVLFKFMGPPKLSDGMDFDE